MPAATILPSFKAKAKTSSFLSLAPSCCTCSWKWFVPFFILPVPLRHVGYIRARVRFLLTKVHSVPMGKNDFKESMWYHTLTKQVKLGIPRGIYLALILGSRSMRISSVRPAWVDLAFKQMHRRIQFMAEYNWLKHACLLVFSQHKYEVIRSKLSGGTVPVYFPPFSLLPSSLPFLLSLPSFQLGSLFYYVFKKRGGQEHFHCLR